MNRGSGTLKAALYEVREATLLLFSILVERVGTSESHLRIVNADSTAVFDAPVKTGGADADLEVVFDWLSEHGHMSNIEAVGHRLVHGGPHYSQPQRITPNVLKELRELEEVDPEHTPKAIREIRYVARRFPKLPQIAAFDTAFHASLPKVARMYALPRNLFEQGIRRYGFHGLSCEYIVRKLRETDVAAAEGRAIIAHLGNGSSMTAVRGGRSVDTSMGFTPLEGLVMGTRSGDVDPGLLMHLLLRGHTTAAKLAALLNRESGLRGVSETSADMRDLLQKEAADTRAAEAVDLFCYRARKYVGAYAAVLGGLDALVFAGGIGEHAVQVRERICSGLEFLGLELDPSLNEKNGDLISSPRSRVRVRVIQTDEDWMIAQHVLAVLGATNS